ncbi:hypothetical protein GCM10010149_91690 [Nonomuraea roseoviolacea subsp. roseoviolacea]|uniref:DUF4192 domain-containing protein n=1 Tax=Nonomuraea roseoviolacea TaxID=103837 RepID=UPI0031DEC78D
MPDSPDSNDHAVSLKDPADFIAIVPYLLGFHPDRSLVAMAFDGDALKGVIRFDLPDSSEDAPDAATYCARLLAQNAARYVFLIGYGSGQQVTPIMDGLFTAVTGAGMEILDMIRCEGDRFWSYICKDPHCCSPEGVPYDINGSHVAAGAVLAGRVAMPDRESFARTLEPVEGPERQAVRTATAAARARAESLIPTVDAGYWFIEGTRHVRKCLDHVRAGRPIPVEELAWLGVLLTGIQIRDIALTFQDEYGDEVSHRFWTEVTRRLEPEYVPAAAVNLALLAYRAGDGALARLAAERALRADPDYRFAHMILFALNAGVPPMGIKEIDFADLAREITALSERSPRGAQPVLPEPLSDN